MGKNSILGDYSSRQGLTQWLISVVFSHQSSELAAPATTTASTTTTDTKTGGGMSDAGRTLRKATTTSTRGLPGGRGGRAGPVRGGGRVVDKKGSNYREKSNSRKNSGSRERRLRS